MITAKIAIGEHLNIGQLPGLHLYLQIGPQIDETIPEAPGRFGLPGLLELMGAKVGVEVGVWRGEFSAYLLSHWPGKLWLVDSWEERENYLDVANVSREQHAANYQAALDAVAPHAGRVDIIKGCSVCAAPFFDGGCLDFVFLDAEHSYEAVTEDLNAWLPKLRPGGLMCGHDFLNYSGPLGEFRVKAAVLDFTRERGAQVYASREPWPSLWYFVNGR